ncbi:MAG TPA: protein kinase [Thermoanaerobaculia bacterium]|nr:protein kinase [Thermoanaerobaculia bacterium]
MNLRPGDKVGRYEIASFIGAGGMGQVYRARDVQLGREVAVKLLPTASAGSPAVVERFHNEARALGLLTHQNLVTVFDFGTYGDSFYIVLELLEGHTLRERMPAGVRMSQRRAIQWALEIVRGMAAAHDRGIIHRDLKPENIFITRDGRVKILDFGLAKMNPELDALGMADDAQTVVGVSTPGMVLGTVGYISPEQLRGEKVDHRADIFAFGAILYEMLAGQRAFRGTTAADVLSSVLKDDPVDLRELGVVVLPGLDLIIHRCLEKQPQNRFQSAHDLALALEALGSSTDSLTLPFFTTLRSTAKRFRRAAAIAALVVAAAILGALTWSRAEPNAPPQYRQLTFRRGDISAARFTSDGAIAYSASWEGNGYQLYAGRTDSVDARALGINCRELLSVSHNGMLALLVRTDQVAGTLATVSLAGGAPREIVDRVVAADWSPDGAQLAVARRVDGGYQIEYPIGKVVYRGATRIRDLRVSPDGTHIAFRRREARLGKSFALFVTDVAGTSAKKLGEWTNARGLAWLSASEVAFATGSSGSTDLLAVTLRGKSRLLARFDGLVKLHDVTKDGHILLTRDDYREGIMARAPDAERERDLSWFDGSGTSDISPDGRLLLMSEFGEAGGPRYAVYVRPTSGEPAVKLGDGYGVSLSPDGKSALSIIPGNPARLAIVPLGAGASRLLEPGSVVDYEFGAWLPDGHTIVFTGRTANVGMRLYRQDARGGPPTPLGAAGVRLTQASRPASPDGKQLALIDNDGALHVLTIGGASRKLNVDRGFLPITWSADGRELFVYRENELPAHIYRLNVDTGAMQLVRELMPADAAGVYRITDVVSTPSGSAYAYGVVRNLSSLFDSSGWRF